MSSAPLMDELEDELREHFLEYTRRAFGMLPEMRQPKILDVGCGPGVPTVELAEISSGTVIGLDTDQEALSKLESRAKGAGLVEGRVTTKLCSMEDIDLRDEQFDLIWAEGSVQFIGYRIALTRWRRLLKPGGFLVLHIEMKRARENIQLARKCGYDIVGHFPLPEDAWWDEYYAVLEERLGGLYEIYAGDHDACRALDAKRDEMRMVKKDPAAFRSMFLLLQKAGESRSDLASL